MKWTRLAAIQIGGAICLPTILVGQVMAERFGFGASIAGALIGNAVLLLLGLGVVAMTHRYGLNTVANAERFLGKKGCALFALSFLIVKAGWFAIGLDLMGKSLGHPVFNLLLGSAIVGVVLAGIKGVGRVAALTMPLLIGTMAASLYLAEGTVLTGGHFSMGAISMAVAVSIAPTFNLGTFFMHSRSLKHSMIAVAVVFGLALPLIQGVGIYLGCSAPGELLLMREGHPLWNAWVAFFLVLAGWTTNNNILYSAEVGLRVLLPTWSPRKATLLLGSIGIGLSFFPLLSHFPLLLNLLGISAGAVGSVILTRYLIGGAMTYGLHAVCWALGTAVGLLTSFQVMTLTGMPVLDAVIVGGVGLVLARQLLPDAVNAVP